MNYIQQDNDSIMAEAALKMATAMSIFNKSINKSIYNSDELYDILESISTTLPFALSQEEINSFLVIDKTKPFTEMYRDISILLRELVNTKEKEQLLKELEQEQPMGFAECIQDKTKIETKQR